MDAWRLRPSPAGPKSRTRWRRLGPGWPEQAPLPWHVSDICSFRKSSDKNSKMGSGKETLKTATHLTGSEEVQAERPMRITRAAASAPRLSAAVTATTASKYPETQAAGKGDSFNGSKKQGCKSKMRVSCFDTAKNSDSLAKLGCTRSPSDRAMAPEHQKSPRSLPKRSDGSRLLTWLTAANERRKFKDSNRRLNDQK